MHPFPFLLLSFFGIFVTNKETFKIINIISLTLYFGITLFLDYITGGHYSKIPYGLILFFIILFFIPNIVQKTYYSSIIGSLAITSILVYMCMNL